MALDFVVVDRRARLPVQRRHDDAQGEANWTVIQGTLLGGLVFLALLYLFGMPFLPEPRHRLVTTGGG